MRLFVAILILAAVSSVTHGWKVNIQKGQEYDSTDVSSVRYLLWTRDNPGDDDYYTLEVLDEANMIASPFDASRRTYFIYHGWTRKGLEPVTLNGKTNILSVEDANFIIVDWEEMAAGDYDISVQNVYKAANQSASYIDWMTTHGFSDPSKIHLIGHSLGAHLAGMVGHYVEQGVIDRITGLDPAGLAFYNVDAGQRIDKTCAAFVDIMHTNSCSLTKSCRGLPDAIGHVDFYPNGGEAQPACEGNLNAIGDCSHGLAPVYFVESILATNADGSTVDFKSWPCTSWDDFEAGLCPSCGDGCKQMGYHATRLDQPASFFLRTSESQPYSYGDRQ